MSFGKVRAILESTSTSGTDRLVAIDLAEHANSEGESWPAVDLIAHEALGCELDTEGRAPPAARRTVQRSLRRLAGHSEQCSKSCDILHPERIIDIELHGGHLQDRRPWQWRTNLYRIRDVIPDTSSGVTGDATEESSGVNSPTSEVSLVTISGVNSPTSEVSLVTPKSSKESLEESPKESSSDDDDLFDKVVELEAMRRTDKRIAQGKLPPEKRVPYSNSTKVNISAQESGKIRKRLSANNGATAEEMLSLIWPTQSERLDLIIGQVFEQSRRGLLGELTRLELENVDGCLDDRIREIRAQLAGGGHGEFLDAKAVS